MIYLTAQQCQKLDQCMMNLYHIQIPQLMELAGQRVAEVTAQFIDAHHLGKQILVLCGKGHNGGDGLVALRHLKNWGYDVSLIISHHTASLAPQTAAQYNALKAWQIPEYSASDPNLATRIQHADVIIDGLLGFGIEGAPQGPSAQLIQLAQNTHKPIIAIDIPSGMDASTGVCHHPYISAAATVTFGYPKTGFENSAAKPHLGELYVADIGIPPELVCTEFGLPLVRLFEKNRIIRIEELNMQKRQVSLSL